MNDRNKLEKMKLIGRHWFASNESLIKINMEDPELVTILRKEQLMNQKLSGRFRANYDYMRESNVNYMTNVSTNSCSTNRGKINCDLYEYNKMMNIEGKQHINLYRKKRNKDCQLNLKSEKISRKLMMSSSSSLSLSKNQIQANFIILMSLLVLSLSSFINCQTSTDNKQQASLGCPYPSVGTNCQVNIVAHAPAVPLFSTEYLADEYATLKADTQASYKCDQGFELLGQDTIICLPSGRWSASPPVCVTNIAIGKPTNQSSTVKGGDSKNANDGKLITQHDSRHCTETRVDPSPWWQIDLLQPYEIRSVRLLGRACCNPSLSLHDIEIRVGNSSSLQGNRLCAWNPNNLEEGIARDFQCAHPITGRFVSIQMVGIDAALSLCEVMVFSPREFPPERCNVQHNLAPTSVNSSQQANALTTTISSATTTPSSNRLSQPSDSQLLVFGKTCYEMQITNGGSYLVADTYCRAKGGSLIHSINNLTQSFISQDLERARSKLKSKLVWIGARRENSSPNALVTISSGSSSAAIAIDEPQSTSALVATPIGRSLTASLEDFSEGNIFSGHGSLLSSYESSPLFNPVSKSQTTLYQAIGTGGSTSRGSQTFGLSTGSTQQHSLNRSSETNHSPHRSLIVSQPNQLASFFNQPIPSITTSSSPSQSTHNNNVVMHAHRSLRPPALVSTTPPPQSSLPQQQSSLVQSPSSTQLSWATQNAQTTVSSPSQIWRWVGDAQSDTLLSQINTFYWADDQPNNYNNQQDCMVLDGSKKWQWNDVTCELDYLPWICQYRPSTCGSPDRNENSTILELSSPDGNSNQETLFTFGKIVTYTCPVGHKLDGSRQRKCQYDGTWSGKAPKCQYVNCGPINSQSIENGRFVYLNQSQTTLGSQIKYVCYEDYVLVGTDLRQCGNDGKWTGKQPICAYKWCPMLQQIPNGFLNVSSYSENSIATYQCNSGYKLVGNDTRQCLLGGKWTNQEPFCQYVECGQPKHIANGNYELMNQTTNYLSVALYTCNTNYTLVGTNNKMICSHTNRWTGKEPQCTLIDCGQPQSNPGTSLSANSFTVHSTVEYKCDPGFKEISGTSERVCGLDGRWTGSPLTCKYVDCGRVPAILKGEISYINGTTYLASQVTYECTPGNRLSGHRVRFCGPDGRWTGTSPKCEEVRCDAPELPSNGSAIYIGNDRSFKEQSFSVGVTVQYQCDFGHVVKGSWASRLCQANGEWSGEAPVCQFVECGLPSPIENGNYILKHPPSGAATSSSSSMAESTRRSDSINQATSTRLTYYGAIAHYNCDPNFKIDGPPQRECLESGQWRQPLPVCEPVQCPKPDFFDEYTQVSLVSRTIGSGQTDTSDQSSSSATKLSGAIRLIANNQWINHDSSQQSFGVGDKLHYSCIPGFELYGGPETRVCTQYGQWSGSSTPRCRLIDCGRPSPIGQEGRFYLLNETTTFNSIVEYSCVRPFKLIEQKIRQAGNLIETLQAAQAGVTQILTSLPIGVKVCANNGQWMPNDQQPRCVSASSGGDSGVGQFDGADNTLDGYNRINSIRDSSSSTPTVLNGSNTGLNHNTNPGDAIGDDLLGQSDSIGSQLHDQHHSSQSGSSTSLWAKVMIVICLMVMFGLIMLTLICIRSGKKSDKQTQRTIMGSNGHPPAAMQIQLANNGSNGAMGRNMAAKGIPQQTQLSNNQNIYMDGPHHKMFSGLMMNPQTNQVPSIHHMTTMHMPYGDVSASVNNNMNQSGLAMNTHPNAAAVMKRSMVNVGGGGEVMMNGKSSSLGLVSTSDRMHINGNANEHSVSLNSSSGNIMDSYSRLSIESDPMDRSNQHSNSSANKTIRHNPNGLVTFVSPAQQHGKQNGSIQHSNGSSNDHQKISPQSISTTLSISSSSSSAPHTTATRLSTTDSASSSSSSSSDRQIIGHLNANGDYQSPQQSFVNHPITAQTSPPSLPANPPPSHRLQQHHKQLVVVKRHQQQQKAQNQSLEGASNHQGKMTLGEHHYMEPSI